jgi:hypothetical protein
VQGCRSQSVCEAAYRACVALPNAVITGHFHKLLGGQAETKERCVSSYNCTFAVLPAFCGDHISEILLPAADGFHGHCRLPKGSNPVSAHSLITDRECNDALQHAPTEGVDQHSLRLIAACLTEGKRCDQLHEDPVNSNPA